MNNIDKIKSFKKEFALTSQEIKTICISESFSGFLGCTCTRCRTRYNLPAGLSKSTWKCRICNVLNDFDFVNIFLPFNEPQLGPMRNVIERGLKMKPVKVGDNEKRNGVWKEYPCYYRM